jgi:hypothetical protein
MGQYKELVIVRRQNPKIDQWEDVKRAEIREHVVKLKI